ncbi:AMP-binding protein [Dysgonomonas sp. 520]|uniref:AMP-binding protein n=1 Tax=Dysgonomonas sp. 520 TaxID=2302931 RepID=UPI0013D2C1FB|nr:AMP-binding protein [Dysgonomonas sp. 520]NDW08077.1 long-chain fatty acid--CoA ligase [Dysgonomonas sp. 520]
MKNSFLQLVKDGITNNWDKPALTDIEKKTYTYKHLAEEMAKLHLLFEALGVKKGDKIALCGANSTHWAIGIFATLSYGAAATTILHDFNAESVHRIVNHSESKILFVGSTVWKRLAESEMPQLDSIILIDDFSILKSNISGEFDVQVAFDKKFPNGFTKENVYIHDEQPEDLAILNYTSGTTSNPKGVMIPYRSLWSNTRFAIDNIPFVKAGDGFVCMLPMAHMYGLAFEVLLSITKGSHMHFISKVPSPQIILGAFALAKPTLVIAVPLIIEKIIRSKVFPVLKKQPVSTLVKIPVLRDIVFKKIRKQLIEAFGGNIVEVVIGGAALNKEIGDFLTKIKFPYTVGYGMTECGPLISYDYWETYRATSCGKPVDRMEVKIDSEDPQRIAGEILVRGMNVMSGYFKDPEATASAIDKDGWLYTGDLGVMDENDFIYIRGRSKTMILGASGQNIYPEEIEDFLNNSIFVSESLVVEDSKNKLVALIYPDLEYLKANKISDEDLRTLLDKEIKQINGRLANYSQISRYVVREEEFEKTPKRSIKRFLYQNEAK